MNDSKWPDTRELWVCLNCGSVEWHLRGEGKAILCECVAGVWTTMVQVWPAPSGWISVVGMPDNAGKCVVLVAFPDGFRDSFLAKRHEGEWWVASSAAFWHGTPTYYMPVPTAPE